MSWRWGWVNPYPGKGPWSWLPPPLRPGWVFGRGWCWYWLTPWQIYGAPWTYRYYYYPWYWTPWTWTPRPWTWAWPWW